MKKLTLAVAISTAISASTFAQDNLETITVTATRAAEQTAPTLASQIVIGRTEIELAQVESVPELLSRYAGIDVAQNGGRGQTASVFIRGASSDQTLVLINGLRVNTASNGGATWSTISPELIERIEIIKGPRAAVWGSDAIGGVINIITRQNASGSVTLNAKYGTNNTQSYYLGTSIAHGDGATTIAVNKESSDGFDVFQTPSTEDVEETDDDGYDNLSLTINGNQAIGDALTLNWLFKASDQDTDFDSTYLNRAENENREWLIGGDYTWSASSIKNTTNVTVGSTRDVNLSFGNGRAQENGDLFETRRNQLSVTNTSVFSDAFTLAVGTDQYNEKVVSSTAFAQTRRRVEGYFGHALFSQDAFTAELAIRYDDVENIDSETTYNASVGYQITDSVLVSLAKGSGFKAPTFNDLYFPFGGNPDLLSETSDTEEVNVKFVQDAFDVSLSWYNTDIDNLIEWAPDDDGIWQPRNIAAAEIEGIDVTINYRGLGGAHTLNYGYLDAIDSVKDTRLVRRAKNQFSYQFMTHFGDTDLLLNYEYKGERFDAGTELDSYQLVDLSVNHHFTDDLSGQIKLHNVFDEDYETVLNYQVLGRAVYVSVNYQL